LSRPDLRLIVITDRALAAPRTVEQVVRECLEAGAPAIQLRDKDASAAELLQQALVLRELTRRYGALLFVNDRLDVALVAGADGVHLGPDDVPVHAARQAVPAEFLIGCSTDQPELARAYESAGASYIGCGAVFGTSSKAEVAAEQIGPAGLRAVVASVAIPVVGIGGITPANVAQVAVAGAAGCAVIGAVMKAGSPGQVTAALLRVFSPPA
jgi:thiamine-phosphate pyrophosphorylase